MISRVLPSARSSAATCLPRADIEAGDLVLGLPSSGSHSNGFSLVRKIVARSGARLDGPRAFRAGKTLGEALLTPTRIYVKPVLSVLAATDGVKALGPYHRRRLSRQYSARAAQGVSASRSISPRSPVPPVFGWLAAAGGVARGGDAAHIQLRHRHGCRCRPG